MLPGTQQTPPPAAAAVNPAINAATKNFTHAELGQRSMALGVDKKLQRMNDEQSQSGRSSLRQLLGTEPVSITDDRSFSSITDIEQLPPSVISVLMAHGLGFSQGDKIMHQPGASFFSLVTTVDGVKKYQTFSLDEPAATRPETEVEPNSPTAPVIVETPVESQDAKSFVAEVVPEPVQGIGSTPVVADQVPEAPVAGTLGTIGVSPRTVSQDSVPTPESIKESIREELKSMETPKVELPLERAQKMLTDARNASGREREAYTANTYRDRADGTFSALFGNNAQVHDKLFVTMAKYESAKKNYLSEMKQQSPSFSNMIAWERDEQARLSELLPHAKFGVYRKIANVFHLAPPVKLETRSLIIANAPAASRVAMAQQLGIHDLTKQEPAWMKLLSPLEQKSLPVSRMNVSQPVIKQEEISTEPILESTLRKPDYKKIYTKLHAIMRLEWKLDKSVISENPESLVTVQPIINTVSEVVSTEKPDETPTSVTEEAVPVAASLEPAAIEPVVSVAPVPLQFGTKQHPESLFA